MFGWLAKALAFCYQIWPSYGGAIVLLTVAIMIVLLPLTLKGTRSMLEMQRIQPELKKLQNRYKDDRQRLNEEVMALYKEHGVNPIGGCLPMLLQIPVFWVLYRVLEGLTHRAPMGADVGAALTGSTHAITTAGHFQPSYISSTSKLYEALHSTGKMMSLGVDLSESVLTAMKKGMGHAAPFLVLMVLVIATTYIQQWQMQSRTPKDAVNPQQQTMMKIMPLVFAVIYFAIPAGVVVYFLASNVFRIGQQYFITRTMYPATAGAEVAAGNAPATARGWRSLLPSTESLPQVRNTKPAKSPTSAKGGRSGSAKGGGSKRPPNRGGQGGSQRGKGAAANKGGKGAKASSQNANGGKGVGAQTPKPQGNRPGSKVRPAAKPAVGAKGAGGGDGAGGTNGASGNGASGGRAASPTRKSPPPPRRTGSKKKRK
ncbi:MAG TPA: membrane protein insertase YidC [Acidimicrobiales bacterium]|jgi:YidC/Oxa1 family membrane protein insertase|nr:membrane protein insertase YidC [Acidimicrobiales bacterium]